MPACSAAWLKVAQPWVIGSPLPATPSKPLGLKREALPARVTNWPKTWGEGVGVLIGLPLLAENRCAAPVAEGHAVGADALVEVELPNRRDRPH